MALTDEQFEELVKGLETESKVRPGLYKQKVFGLALLGYGYIALVFIGVLSAIGIVIAASAFTRSLWIAAKLIVPLALFTAYMARALWVRFPKPEGRSLTRNEARALFEMSKEIRRTLKSPRMHKIVLIDDFNAAVVQVPRLGIFGWYKNYLLIGVPLMQAMSADQFRGVLAHELGHLSSAHGRFSAWVYRVRTTWAQLMFELERRNHWGAGIFTSFLNWYVPKFNAYSFVLARAQEYEADRAAAQLVGAGVFAQALIRLDVLGAYLQSVFWPDLFKRADNDPEPPSSPFLEMANAFRSGFTVDQAGEWLAESLQQKTGCADTHPCLADRLAALGVTADPPSSNEITAAQVLLGNDEASLCKSLDEEWHQSIAARWKERHQYAREAQSRLAEFDAGDPSALLTVEQEWDHARYTEEFRDSESALPLYEKVLALDPKHPGASFAVGRLLIRDDYPRATTLIEQAMKQDDEYVIPGCHLIYSQLIATGREQEAEQYKNRLLNQSVSYEAARAERSVIRTTDAFIPHNLNWDQLQKLGEQFERYADIKCAYLVCKRVKYFPETPLYVIGIDPVKRFYKPFHESEGRALSAKLAQSLSFPGDFFCIVFIGASKPFKEALEVVQYSLIYERENRLNKDKPK